MAAARYIPPDSSINRPRASGTDFSDPSTAGIYDGRFVETADFELMAMNRRFVAISVVQTGRKRFILFLFCCFLSFPVLSSLFCNLLYFVFVIA